MLVFLWDDMGFLPLLRHGPLSKHTWNNNSLASSGEACFLNFYLLVRLGGLQMRTTSMHFHYMTTNAQFYNLQNSRRIFHLNALSKTLKEPFTPNRLIYVILQHHRKKRWPTTIREIYCEICDRLNTSPCK